MVLGANLDLRQRQSLVMTPQLQQAIKLLQMSNVELTDFVLAELERNPVLERIDGAQAAGPEDAFQDPPTHDTLDSVDSGYLTGSGDLPASGDMPLDTGYESLYTEDSGSDCAGIPETGLAATDWSGSRGSGGSFDDPDVRLDQSLSTDISLRAYLSEQVSLLFSSQTASLIGSQLIDAVNETGYLGVDIDTLADQLGVNSDQVAACLETLQKNVEPAGLLARDLKECLRLQLQEKDRFDPLIAAFLEHLPKIAEGHFKQTAKAIGCDIEDITDMLTDIRQLDPKPGFAFGITDCQTLIPDVLVRRQLDDSWVIDLNTEALPRLIVNNQYRATVSKMTPEEKSFLTESAQSANWLVRALDQRAQTILKVATEIIQQQESFFLHGIRFMKPLTLKDIADAVDIHESTVSRVTSNKYIATPRGIFELKFFFTTGLLGSEGDVHSSESIRHRMRELIDGESPDRILSDDKLVDLLKAEGIAVARRTVAKYRESMNIGSSVQRRRAKRLSRQT